VKLIEKCKVRIHVQEANIWRLEKNAKHRLRNPRERREKKKNKVGMDWRTTTKNRLSSGASEPRIAGGGKNNSAWGTEGYGKEMEVQLGVGRNLANLILEKATSKGLGT